MVNFTDHFEMFKFCDPLFLKYMLIMQSCDSSSYVFFKSPEMVKENNILFEEANITNHQIWYQQQRNLKDDKNEELESLGYYQVTDD